MPSAIHLSNGNLSVYSVTPPSSGVVYQYILNILNGRGIMKMGINANTAHRRARAHKHTHTHTCTHAHMHAHTFTHSHTHK